ncbi:MAG: NAD(P)/FAD-dependent oxidoreductase [Fimbriimonas sp.]
MKGSVPAGAKRRVVIIGGGFGGAYAAQELSRRVDASEVEVTLLDRNNYMLFYPLLVEAGVGVVEPRHVVVPLRKFLPRGDFRMAEVQSIDLARKQVEFHVIGCDENERLHFDHLVFALGSVTKIPATIPGLREYGYELKSLGDAIELRDRAIRMLELANTMEDPRERRDLLRVIVVGANFTGIELAGEYHAFLTELVHDYPNVQADDIEVMVLEYAERILPAVDAKLAQWCHDTLTKRGLDIRTKTSLTEVGERHCVLTTGERVPTQTVVWAAGIAPHPMVAKIEGLPLNAKGYIDCEPDLRVKGFDDVWAIGDSATVFDASGKPYAATAQNASRQGPLVAQNIWNAMNGRPLKPFEFKGLGSFAAIGRRQAAAEVMGRNVPGFLGWLLYRGAYLMKMPTFAMKARLLMDWVLEFFLHSTPVQLGVHRPARESVPVEIPTQNSPPGRAKLLR